MTETVFVLVQGVEGQKGEAGYICLTVPSESSLK